MTQLTSKLNIDKDAVYQVNHKLRELAQSDDRLSFIDFGRQLLSDQNYGRDKIHSGDSEESRSGILIGRES